jgi:anti-anti-sigma factor
VITMPQRKPTATVVTLDNVTCKQLESRLSELVDAGERRFVIDLEGVSYINSAILRILLATLNKLTVLGGTICFSSVQDQVMDVFDVVGFLSVFRFFKSREEAVTDVMKLESASLTDRALSF